MTAPELQGGGIKAPPDGDNGMHGSEAKPGERVKNVHFTDDTMVVDLMDGRTIIVPLAWYPRLFDASPEQRQHWEISGAGYGIHWPELDEDLSTEGLLRGAPAAAEPEETLRWKSQKH